MRTAIQNSISSAEAAMLRRTSGCTSLRLTWLYHSVMAAVNSTNMMLLYENCRACLPTSRNAPASSTMQKQNPL